MRQTTDVADPDAERNSIRVFRPGTLSAEYRPVAAMVSFRRLLSRTPTALGEES